MQNNKIHAFACIFGLFVIIQQQYLKEYRQHFGHSLLPTELCENYSEDFKTYILRMDCKLFDFSLVHWPVLN